MYHKIEKNFLSVKDNKREKKKKKLKRCLRKNFMAIKTM